MDKVLPNLVIAGAAKAGTTSLHAWLAEHPDVYMSGKKEPGYFIHGYGFFDLDQYSVLFEKGAGKTIIGEASTAYLAAPESADWIKETLEDPKILISLRNPIERAFSQYNWMVMVGLEWLSSFEEALEQEDSRTQSHRFRWKSPEWFRNYEYFKSGLYYSQVKRYMDSFKSENVKVVLFDDLVKEPANIYSEVCGFLGIKEFTHKSLEAKNVSHRPRSVMGQYLLRGLRKAGYRHPKLQRVIRRKYVDALMKQNLKLGQRPQLRPETRKLLQDRYREDITFRGALRRGCLPPPPRRHRPPPLRCFPA